MRFVLNYYTIVNSTISLAYFKAIVNESTDNFGNTKGII